MGCPGPSAEEDSLCPQPPGGGRGGSAAGTTNPRGWQPRRRKGRSRAGRARARQSEARGAPGPRSGSGLLARETMSSGSSCSQTPSRAIPTTRRVVLGDGVQLPPGDYSTTPGGTLFSTTPGGRRGPGGAARGLWVRTLGRTDWPGGGIGDFQLDGATRLRGVVTGKNG